MAGLEVIQTGWFWVTGEGRRVLSREINVTLVTGVAEQEPQDNETERHAEYPRKHVFHKSFIHPP